MSTDPDIPDRVADLINRTTIRRTRTRETRATLTARRQAGLTARHTRKLARTP